MKTEKTYISSFELSALLKTNKILLIDVRSLTEFEEGHIGNALHRPMDTLTDSVGDIPKENQIVTYCNKGHGRSEAAMNLLREAGWKNCQWLEEGYRGWIEAGYAEHEPKITSS
jgi:rhodanese-related sulfurtransferase